MAQVLSKTYALEQVKMPYPHVKILEPSDALALMVPSLPKGDLALICEYKGTTRKLASIAYSAVALSHLIKVSKLELHRDATTYVAVNSIVDALEAMSEWML